MTDPLFFTSGAYCGTKIEHKMLVFAFTRFLVGLAKKRGWMNGREHPWCELRRQHLAPFPGDSESRAENGLRRSRTHYHDEVGLNDPQFRFQPGTAGSDFVRVRLLMNPAFAARLPLEVFHHVRDVNLRPINSSFLEGAVHDFPSRTNERFARHIFVIARLFAN